MGNARWIFSDRERKWQDSQVESVREKTFGLEWNGETLQSVTGFGGCFNELGALALSDLAPERKKALLDDLFLDADGCNFSVCRLPVGASDYAAEWYSADETDGDYGLEHFSIDRDRWILLPYAREGVSRRSDMILFASPWSPPAWMKFPKAYNHGTMRWEKENLEAYARYLLRFIRACAEGKVPIRQLHIQNEPTADQKYPSCIWTGEQLRDFIKGYLGPLFVREGSPAEIWLGTLNGPFEDYGTEEWQKTEYHRYAFPVLTDDEARSYVAGVGYQWGGKHAITQTHESFPEVRLMQTENECGDGKNSWEYMEYVFDLMKLYFRNGVEAYVYWNMVLPEGGSSTWGWKQNALINIGADGTVTYNPEYYLMKHVSSFVKRGARLLGVKGRMASDALAFANPDGSIAVIVKNVLDREMTLAMRFREELEARLPARSVNTFLIR